MSNQQPSKPAISHTRLLQPSALAATQRRRQRDGFQPAARPRAHPHVRLRLLRIRPASHWPVRHRVRSGPQAVRLHGAGAGHPGRRLSVFLRVLTVSFCLHEVAPGYDYMVLVPVIQVGVCRFFFKPCLFAVFLLPFFAIVFCLLPQAAPGTTTWSSWTSPPGELAVQNTVLVFK